MRPLLMCLPLCLLMAPDSLPPERPPERPALHDVVDKGGKLPDEATMVRLAQTDPVAFLEWCNIRYDREVSGYHLNFKKQERLDGKLKTERGHPGRFQREAVLGPVHLRQAGSG